MSKFYYVSSSKKDFDLPTRSTYRSAGYDFHSPKDYVIEPNETVYIPLGVKIQLSFNRFLMLVPRSSLGLKNNNFIVLRNTVGIIDEDYYNNPTNEGEISIALYNFGDLPFFIKKNDKIVQGIILFYDTIDDDEDDTKEVRIGGFGSTDIPLNSGIDVNISNIWTKKMK